MAEDDKNDEVQIYLLVLEVEGEHPTSVFRLSNPLEKLPCQDSSICRALFSQDQVPIQVSTKPDSIQLKFQRANDLVECVELELTNGEHERTSNLELIIEPLKATAVLTSYDTAQGMSVLWRSTTIYSVVSMLDPKVKSVVLSNSDALKMIFGATVIRFRGHISKDSFYPLAIDFKRDFVPTGILGKGAHGSVYRCSRGIMPLAVKKVSKERKGNPCSEVEAMAKLSGANHVVQMYCAWSENAVSGLGYVYIGIEVFESNLDEYLDARKGVNLQKSTTIFAEIMAGVKEIHEAGIIHRDLKPLNILIDSDDHIYITDFGISKIKPYPSANVRYPGGPQYGTQFYCDPILNSTHLQHDEKVDFYSCGIIYFEMHLLGITKRRAYEKPQVADSEDREALE
uniref:non-specific serine/threonine protein kinase n=1 Tax=Oryza meridionalis TaxID=40149 RepID=A0A0E0D050_9ORYZ